MQGHKKHNPARISIVICAFLAFPLNDLELGLRSEIAKFANDAQLSNMIKRKSCSWQRALLATEAT